MAYGFSSLLKGRSHSLDQKELFNNDCGFTAIHGHVELAGTGCVHTGIHLVLIVELGSL